MAVTVVHLSGARLQAWSTSEHWAGHTHMHSRSMMLDLLPAMLKSRVRPEQFTPSFMIPAGCTLDPWECAIVGTLGGSYSYGTFINAKNAVVGYSTTDKFDNRIHAFLRDENGKMRDLGSLGSKTLKTDQSFALGVNGNNEVVGYSYLPPTVTKETPPTAFVYMKGVMMNLNDLIGEA